MWVCGLHGFHRVEFLGRREQSDWVLLFFLLEPERFDISKATFKLNLIFNKRHNMTSSRKILASLTLAAGLSAFGAMAQIGPAPYGSPITLEQAKKAMVAAEAEARKNNWQVVISIVDSGGHLVMLQRLDAQTGSIEIATGKAATSAALRRPTKAIEDSLAPGGSALRILSVRSVTALQGGVPILLDGKIIGAIGVSGVTAPQDEVVAMAGAAAVAAK